MEKNEHPQHFKLAIGFTREGVLIERRKEEDIPYLCSELLQRFVCFDTDLK
jgi:hypothetical protein